jgi:SAM-dependent methyltransferase
MTLRSQDGTKKVPILAEVKRLSKRYNAVFTQADGSEIRVTDNLIDTVGDRKLRTSLAQASNSIPLTASVYEDTWRVKSIGILSGQDFSIDDETQRLVEWLQPQSGEWILDVGCSSAVYARALAKAAPEAEIIAMDLARPMLTEARSRCLADGVDAYLLQADASDMPLFTASMDKLAMGGTLNELYDPAKALYECRRVLKPGGLFFVMYLLKAETWAGRLLQKSAEVGGIQFWSLSEADALFERCGFEVKRRATLGIVDFVLLE